MPWFKVTFMVEADDEESFNADLDEDKIAVALPGRTSYLATIEQ